MYGGAPTGEHPLDVRREQRRAALPERAPCGERGRPGARWASAALLALSPVRLVVDGLFTHEAILGTYLLLPGTRRAFGLLTAAETRGGQAAPPPDAWRFGLGAFWERSGALRSAQGHRAAGGLAGAGYRPGGGAQQRRRKLWPRACVCDVPYVRLAQTLDQAVAVAARRLKAGGYTVVDLRRPPRARWRRTLAPTQVRAMREPTA